MNSPVTVTLVGKKKKDISSQLISLTCQHEVNKVPFALMTLATGSFADRKYPLFEVSDYEVGKPLEIKIRYEKEQSQDETIFKGIVTSRKLAARQGGEKGALPVMILRLDDPAFRLHQAVNTNLFSKKNDKQMIEQVLTEAEGVSLKKAHGSLAQVKFDQFVRKNSSAWRFMMDRLSAHGLLTDIENGAITAWTPDETEGSLSLEAGMDPIIELAIEEDARSLYKEAGLEFWNTEKDSMELVQKKLSEALAKNAKAPAAKLIEAAIATKAEATALLNRFQTHQTLSILKGHLVIPGNAKVKLRQKLTLKSLPTAFNGGHAITQVTHKITGGFWTTEIRIGYPPMAVLGPGKMPSSAQAMETVMGKAMKWEKDPEKLGRVPVEVRAFGKGKYWAFPAQQAAGSKQRGFMLPEAGEQVMIGFMHGSYTQGAILTSLYFKDKLLTAPFKMDEKSPVGFVSSSEMQLIFNDDKKMLHLMTGGKLKLAIDDDKKIMQLVTPDTNTLTLNDKKGIHLDCKKEIGLKAKTKFGMEASASMKLKAKSIDLN